MSAGAAMEEEREFAAGWSERHRKAVMRRYDKRAELRGRMWMLMVRTERKTGEFPLRPKQLSRRCSMKEEFIYRSLWGMQPVVHVITDRMGVILLGGKGGAA